MSEKAPFPLQKLGEVVEILDHLRIPVNSEARDKRRGDVPYYGANGLQGWIDKPLFNEPLILMAEDGGNFDDFSTRPIAYRIDGPAWVNNHAHIIKAENPNLHSFIYWSVAHKDIRKHVSGGTRQKLNQSALKEIEIPWPPEDEAGIVSTILDTLDTQIQKTEALIGKLEKVKEGLLHDLLTRGIDENGQLRPSPEQAPELYKESPLGLIPREWEAVSLGEASDLQVGYAFKSSWFEDSGVYRLLRGDNVGYGEPDWSSKKFLPEKSAKRFFEYLLNEGDIVIGMDRTFTKSGVKITEIRKKDTPSLLVQRVGRFMPINGKTKNNYIKAVITSPQYLSELAQQEKGMDIPHLSKSEILSPIIPLPALKEQEMISHVANGIDLRVRISIMEVETLCSTKQALMDDLLTGRVRVTPLLDQAQAPPRHRPGQPTLG